MNIAVQSYTFRTLLATDFERTFAKVAEIGYREVELHDLFGRTAAQVRRVLDAAGLSVPARHVPLDELRTGLEQAIADSHTLGCDWVVCPFIHEFERSPAGYEKVADDLNKAAATCRDAGLGFAYHNHDFEFAPLEDLVPYDLLLERCDADLVGMEIDLFWVTKAGANPLEYLSRYPGRFPLVHVKDMAVDGTMADVGTGTIEFAAIFEAADEAGFKQLIVEHDEPRQPLESITTSFSGLSRLLEGL